MVSLIEIKGNQSLALLIKAQKTRKEMLQSFYCIGQTIKKSKHFKEPTYLNPLLNIQA